MATKQIIIADLGSEETRQVRINLNNLIDVVEGIQVATIASIDATDLAEVITLANEMKASLNVTAAIDTTKLRELVASVVVPVPPQRPTV